METILLVISNNINREDKRVLDQVQVRGSPTKGSDFVIICEVEFGGIKVGLSIYFYSIVTGWIVIIIYDHIFLIYTQRDRCIYCLWGLVRPATAFILNLFHPQTAGSLFIIVKKKPQPIVNG